MWALIWTVLVLGLLAMLVLLGLRLFRKALTALAALGRLTDSLERLDAANEELREAAFVPAALRPQEQVAAEYRTRRDARESARELKAEARLARGRLLTSADLRQRTFPWESSATRSPGGT